jgi:riboflavin kinase/FMN adenylyltransferase
MQHIRDLSTLDLEHCGLTIGSFDGVHIGHQALVAEMVRQGGSDDVPSVVLTFYPHPSVVLRGRQPSFYITSPEEKAELLGALGVDYIVTFPFDEQVSKITAGEFVQLLQTHLGLQRLWIGADFALGYQREGNRHFLAAAGKEHGFEVHIFPPVFNGGEIVSSTRVREALRSGDVARVETYLGRPFDIPGVVEEGSRRGKTLGFPTANLSFWDERAYPRNGVYACLAYLREGIWPAVTNIGIRPTFDEGRPQPVVEAHLLDFNGEDFYGEPMRLEFLVRLRDEQRFADVEGLTKQIERDVKQAGEAIQRREARNGK